MYNIFIDGSQFQFSASDVDLNGTSIRFNIDGREIEVELSDEVESEQEINDTVANKENQVKRYNNARMYHK